MNENSKELDRHLADAKTDQFPNFRRHHLHASSVGEIHSRPFPEFPTNRVLFHYAFMSEAGASVANAVLPQLCRMRGEGFVDGNLAVEAEMMAQIVKDKVPAEAPKTASATA